MCRDMVFQVLSDYLKRHVYVWQHRFRRRDIVVSVIFNQKLLSRRLNK